MKIGIIGGGITGLTIAYRLALAGEKVTLIEQAGKLGGLAGCFQLGNTQLEKYFHHIFLSDTSVRELIADVGLEPDLFWRETPMGVYADGEIHPFDGPKDLLRFSPLSYLDRIRFGLWILRTGKNQKGISLDSITVREWVQKQWGGKIYENFWRPLLQAKFGEAADNISAAWLWGRIYARANSRAGSAEKLGYLLGGFSRLLEKMAETIRARGSSIFLGSPALRAEQRPNQAWEVTTRDASFQFDRLILAIPSPAAAKLVANLPEEETTAHAAVAYQSVACMTVVLQKPLSSIYWLNVGDSNIPYAGVIEQTNFIPKEAYGGNHLVYLFNYLPPTHPWMSEQKEELFERYEEGLKKMFPSYRREDVVRTMLFRDTFATPIYDVNYLKKVPPLASKLPGLYFANTAHIFPEDRNMNHSVELAGKLLHAMAGAAE